MILQHFPLIGINRNQQQIKWIYLKNAHTDLRAGQQHSAMFGAWEERQVEESQGVFLA